MRFKNYRNSYNNENRIISEDDLWQMAIGEAFDREVEIMSQYRAIGIPSTEALRASSNVVWVDEYTRDDGTKVSGYWRSKPEGGNSETNASAVLTEENNSLKNSEQSEYVKKENEKAVLRKDPENIAGVKRGTPMSFEEAVGEKINPAYFKDDFQVGYASNCQSCVVAYEARRRGYDVQSVELEPASKSEELSYDNFSAWLDSEGKPCEGEALNADNAEDLHIQLDNIVKQGERYAIINFMRRDVNEGYKNEGHIEILDRDNNGNLRLYDPQSNRIRQEDILVGHLASYADFTGQQPTLILRVDDKEFNPYYLDEVVRGIGE